MTTSTNLGRVAIVPKGTWNSATAYTKLNVVSYGGSSYMAIQNVPIGTPVNDTDYWQIVAEKGQTGGLGQVAEIFDATKNYAVGDYCIYNDDLYRFTTAHSAGAWNSAHVALISITDEFKTKQNALTFDTMPTASSTNPVESGGVKTALATKADVSDLATKADVSDIAPAFDETENYIINNFVTYNGDFYRFIADHTAGAWNPAEVKQITVADAFNGQIHFVSPDIDMSAPAPSSAQYASAFFIDDTNGENLARIEVFRRTTDTIALRFGVRRVINDVVIFNQFDMLLTSDGTRSYTISDPEAFRNALGLNDSGTANCTLGTGVTGTLTVRSLGKIVFFNCSVRITSGLAANNNLTIGTIPSGYRPAENITVIAGDRNRWGSILIRTTGVMTFYNANSAIDANGNVYGNCMFIK